MCVCDDAGPVWGLTASIGTPTRDALGCLDTEGQATTWWHIALAVRRKCLGELRVHCTSSAGGDSRAIT